MANIFNQISETFNKNLIDKFGNYIKMQSEEYITNLKNLREQGFKMYLSALERPNLPDGYKALQSYINIRSNWIPKVNTMWMHKDVAMTPFAQMKINDIIVAETYIDISDSTLLLLPKILRSMGSVYLPKFRIVQNKLHMQIIGPPGTTKSSAITCAASLSIEDTYVLVSGASEMGSMGKNESQRITELMHEISGLITPDKEQSGSSGKFLAMKLTQLSEGKTIYTTTIEADSNNNSNNRGKRQHVRTESDYTNVIIGCRNIQNQKLTQGGRGEAMYDRFTLEDIRPIIVKGRANMIERIFKNNVKPVFDELHRTEIEDRYKLIQRAKMEYCANICYYNVPLPDLSLFADLAPLAMAYLANLRPELYFKLRNISDTKTKIYEEIINYAANMAVCSALNPSAKTINKFDERTGRNREVIEIQDTYDTQKCMEEMGKYAYSNMEIITYVLSESMYQLTSADTFYITKLFAQKFASFFTYGEGIEKTDPSSITPWPISTDIGRSISQMGVLSTTTSLDEFVDLVVNNSACDYLGVPSNDSSSSTKRYGGRESSYQYYDRQLNYTSYELTEVDIDETFESVFMLNTNDEFTSGILSRVKTPDYKEEYISSISYINPNYVRIQGSFDMFSKRNTGKIGNYNLDESAIKDLLWSLTKKTMITPYMPLIDPNSIIMRRNGIHKIQSLRYISRIVKTWPKYKVPVVILDNTNMKDGTCFYILVSYFETDPYSVIRGMIEHISYNATRECKTIMGVPSKENPLIYNPIDIKPIRGKVLIISKKNALTLEKMNLLELYLGVDVEMSDDIDVKFKNEDLEHKRALEHLAKNYPELSFDEINKYTPKGIWERLYGPNGTYTNINSKNLSNQTYPNQFVTNADKEVSIPYFRDTLESDNDYDNDIPLKAPSEPYIVPQSEFEYSKYGNLFGNNNNYGTTTTMQSISLERHLQLEAQKKRRENERVKRRRTMEANDEMLVNNW